jgi:hypothetical protein
MPSYKKNGMRYQSPTNFTTKLLYVIIVLTLRVNTISRGWPGGYSLSGSETGESVQLRVLTVEDYHG